MMNVNIKINHALSHLPLEKAKGSAKQRLDKAIQTSDNFFGNIKAMYDTYGDVTPKLFVNTLKQTAKAKNVQLLTETNEGLQASKLVLNMNPFNANQEGYVMILPTSTYYSSKAKEGTIPKTSAPLFMKTVFTFLNRIFNPKITQREFAVNKYDTRTFHDFYQKNIVGTNKFTAKELKMLLQGRTSQEKIDLLQFFRYYMTEQLHGNRIANKCKTEMDKKFRTNTLDRVPKFQIKAHDFPNKIKTVEAELAKTLKEERANIANS